MAKGKLSHNEKGDLKLWLAKALDNAGLALNDAIDLSALLGDNEFSEELKGVQQHLQEQEHLQDAKIK